MRTSTTSILQNNGVRLALFAIIATITYLTFRSLGSGMVMSWDAFGYYYYYKLAIIDGSLILPDLSSVQAVADLYEPSTTLYQFTHIPDVGSIIRYPIGQALVYLPFFLMGHLVALLSDYPADGFSAPYDFFMRLGAWFYHSAAFVLTAVLLSRVFRARIVAISLLLLFFGTNLIISFSPLLAHGTLMFLIPLSILIMEKYLRSSGRRRYIVLAAVVFGLICLVRPTDVITIIPMALLPFVLVFKSETLGFASVIGWYRKHVRHLALFAAIVLLIGFVQFLYWKIAGGSWIIYSYGNAGEGLDLFSPHTIPFLFGFKTGWFLYTPLMFLTVIVLFVRAFKGSFLMQSISIYIVLFIYLASSWTNYWYGTAYSQRAMIQAYPLLAFPLAALVKFVLEKKGIGPRVLAFIVVSCVLLNFWQAKQFMNGVLTGNTVTARYYFSSFFDLHPDPAKEKYKSLDRYGYAFNMPDNIPDGYKLYDTATIYSDTIVNLEGRPFSDSYKVRYEDFCPSDHCWLRFRVILKDTIPADLLAVITVARKEGNYGYRAYVLDTLAKPIDTDPELLSAEYIYLTPYIRNAKDKITFYLWNRSSAPAEVRELILESYAPENP